MFVANFHLSFWQGPPEHFTFSHGLMFAAICGECKTKTICDVPLPNLAKVWSPWFRPCATTDISIVLYAFFSSTSAHNFSMRVSIQRCPRQLPILDCERRGPSRQSVGMAWTSVPPTWMQTTNIPNPKGHVREKEDPHSTYHKYCFSTFSVIWSAGQIFCFPSVFSIFQHASQR